MSKAALTMDDNSILVIVDMQWQFNSSRNKSTKKACQREILDAMSNNIAIVFLEYDGQGPTLPSLKKLVVDYPFAFFRTKRHDDGSRVVCEVLKEQKMTPKKIIVCGVNTDCCVRSTVWGLAKKLNQAEITVVYEAVNSYYGKEIHKTEYKYLFHDFRNNVYNIGKCVLKPKYHFAANQKIV